MLSEFEKQSLKNQATLILALGDSSIGFNDETLMAMSRRMKEISDLLDPKKSQTLDEKAQDELVGTNDVKTEVDE